MRIMKNFITILLFSLFLVSCGTTGLMSRISSEAPEETVEDDKKQNEIIFEKEFSFEPSIKIARLWLSEKYREERKVKNYEIELYDEELKTLVVNEYYDSPKINAYSFRVTIKGNKATVKFFKFSTNSKRFHEFTEGIAESLFVYIEDLQN